MLLYVCMCYTVQVLFVFVHWDERLFPLVSCFQKLVISRPVPVLVPMPLPLG